MNTNVFFSSASDLWSTPQDFFNTLDAEFHFTLDPCSTHENAKCTKHYTAEENGLAQTWGGEIVFLQSALWAGTPEMGSKSLR